MIGSHLSVAGGMVNALVEAERLGLDCVQVFTKNQRQWKVSPLKDEDRDAWLGKLAEMGWAHRGRVRRDHVVSHNSYLINMASPDAALWKKSVALQRIELERCEALDIGVCVAHPGAHLGPVRRDRPLGSPPTREEAAGLRRIVRALDRLDRDLPGYAVRTALETTAGAGSNLGYDFGHLAFVRDRVRAPERVAFCLDTCHVTAAGYDLSTPTAARSVLRTWRETCGDEHMAAIHLNDSVGAVGSRLDRHAHIGDGTCGRSCFAAILNHRAFRDVPMILETPKGTTEKGTPWDLVNVRRLKRLAKARQGSR